MLRRSLLVLPIVLFTSSLAAADANSVTLGAKGLATGTKYAADESFVTDMTVDAAGKQIPITLNQARKKRVEVLAVKDGIVTKAKITYDQDSETKVQAGKSMANPSSIVGKTFTLTAGPTLEVQSATGKATDDEIAGIKKRERRFGQPDRMAKALAGKKFDKGKPVELATADVADLFGDNSDLEVKKLALTYTGMDGTNAKFDVKMVMAGTKPESDLAFELAGTMVVDPVSGEPTAMNMNGTVKQTKKTKIDGKVTMSAKRTFSK
jgi:hypothetical protein